MLPATYGEEAHFMMSFRKDVDEVVERYYSPLGTTFKTKEDASRVTEADLELNQIVIERVKQSYPDYSIVGEEASHEIGGDKSFVVDPIDGTLMFTLGMPLFGFQIAHVKNGSTVAALIYNPIAKRTLVAERGKGTYCVEARDYAKVSAERDFTKLVFNSGWNEVQRTVHGLLQDKGAQTVSLYSASEIGSMIAIGALAGVFNPFSTPWDDLPPQLIIEEAGGRVSPIVGHIEGVGRQVKGHVLSSEAVHNELVELVRTVVRAD